MEPGDDAVAAALAALGLEGAAASTLGAGQITSAVLVPPDTVVRFPRHQLGICHLLRERTLVAVVASLVEVTLPLPLAADLDAAPPRAFAAHRLVPGEVVDATSIDGLPNPEFDALAAQLARFLQDLTAVPIDELTRAGLDIRSLADMATELRTDVDRLLASRLSAAALRRAHTELALLETSGRDEVVLCHGDLGGNLVWDRDAQRLGVIDWGSSRLSDPALDLASITAGSERLGAAVLERVPHLRDRTETAEAVRGTFALQDMLYGAWQDDWDYVATIVADY